MQRPIRDEHVSWQPAFEADHVLVARVGEVGLVRLHRPQVKNALSQGLFDDLVHAVLRFDDDGDVGVVVITGGEQVFAAGADIREFAGKTPLEMHALPRLEQWHQLRRVRKPLIAAVNGFALGGGCELALACDIVIAGEGAVFGQPEINLGLIPGGGGTQRLIRAVGKAVAMDMILTGRRMPAREAAIFGLASRIVPDELVLDEAVRAGEEIAARPPESVARAKEAILAAESTPLVEGLELERRLFEAAFASVDTQEGLQSFVEKRKPRFGGQRS